MRVQFRLLFLGLILFLVSIFVLLNFNAERYENQVLAYLAYPVLLVNHKVSNFLQTQKLALIASDTQIKNQELQKDLLALQAENIALKATLNYWNSNQALIDYAARYDFNQAILTQVFFKNFTSTEHYILLDKGLEAGVNINMVAVYENCLLGRVTEVYPKYSKLILLTDRNCKIAVYDDQTKALGICCGYNDKQQIMLSYVSHLQKINLDDLLISSGEGEIFPQGFGIGRVCKIKQAGMYYDAHASLLFDIEKISNCYLVAANKS